MGLTLSPENEMRVLRFALDYAAKRWPHANRVTQPQLMDEIEEMKERLRRLESAAVGSGGSK